MTDQKPYLIRAIYQWIIDNNETPQIMIAFPDKGWVHGVPAHLLQSEQLVLNIAPQATPDCVIENDGVYFSTRFGGQPYQVSVAMEAISAIFSRESQQGMGLQIDSEYLSAGVQKKSEETEKNETPKSKRKGHLKIIK